MIVIVAIAATNQLAVVTATIVKDKPIDVGTAWTTHSTSASIVAIHSARPVTPTTSPPTTWLAACAALRH